VSTVIAKTVTKAVLPLILMTSIALFLQGHNLPGGGFIGGVLTAVGLGLVYIVFSIDYLESDVLGRTEKSVMEHFEHSIQEDYRNLFAVGLMVALCTGLTAIIFDLPFLTQDFWILHLPIFSEVHFASAVFFDLGVYFVVVGSLLTVLSVVGEE
jgi:multicomponent Na+:H+ antiporter subunit B